MTVFCRLRNRSRRSGFSTCLLSMSYWTTLASTSLRFVSSMAPVPAMLAAMAAAERKRMMAASWCVCRVWIEYSPPRLRVQAQCNAGKPGTDYIGTFNRLARIKDICNARSEYEQRMICYKPRLRDKCDDAARGSARESHLMRGETCPFLPDDVGRLKMLRRTRVYI